MIYTNKQREKKHVSLNELLTERVKHAMKKYEMRRIYREKTHTSDWKTLTNLIAGEQISSVAHAFAITLYTHSDID